MKQHNVKYMDLTKHKPQKGPSGQNQGRPEKGQPTKKPASGNARASGREGSVVANLGRDPRTAGETSSAAKLDTKKARTTEEVRVEGEGSSTMGPTTDTTTIPLGAVSKATVPKRKRLSSARRRKLLQRQAAKEVESTTTLTLSAKRGRMDMASSSGDTVSAPKRAKIGSFKEALMGVKMAIIADGHPTKMIQQEDLDAIRNHIWKGLLVAPMPKPRFELGNVMAGAIHAVCMDAASAEWLRTVDGSAVGDLKLKVVEAKHLPKPVKMAWKRKLPYKGVAVAEELGLLKCMHEGLRTEEWKVVDQTIEDTLARSIILMDKASAEIIKRENYCLHAGLGRSYFKLLDDGSGKEVAPAQPPRQAVEEAGPAAEGAKAQEGTTKEAEVSESDDGLSELKLLDDDLASSPRSGRTDGLSAGLGELGLASPQTNAEDLSEEEAQ